MFVCMFLHVHGSKLAAPPDFLVHFDLICDRERSLSRSPSHSVHLHFHHRLNPGIPRESQEGVRTSNCDRHAEAVVWDHLDPHVAVSSPMVISLLFQEPGNLSVLKLECFGLETGIVFKVLGVILAINSLRS